MEITGTLRKNCDEWEIVANDGRVCVLSSGAECEVQIAGRWIKTRLEFCHGLYRSLYRGSGWAQRHLSKAACGAHYEHAGHYYAVELGILLCEGLPARVIDATGSPREPLDQGTNPRTVKPPK
jgi:Domain of unknown function (DUF5348)